MSWSINCPICITRVVWRKSWPDRVLSLFLIFVMRVLISLADGSCTTREPPDLAVLGNELLKLLPTSSPVTTKSSRFCLVTADILLYYKKFRSINMNVSLSYLNMQMAVFFETEFRFFLNLVYWDCCSYHHLCDSFYENWNCT